MSGQQRAETTADQRYQTTSTLQAQTPRGRHGPDAEDLASALSVSQAVVARACFVFSSLGEVRVVVETALRREAASTTAESTATPDRCQSRFKYAVHEEPANESAFGGISSQAAVAAAPIDDSIFLLDEDIDGSAPSAAALAPPPASDASSDGERCMVSWARLASARLMDVQPRASLPTAYACEGHAGGGWSLPNHPPSVSLLDELDQTVCPDGLQIAAQRERKRSPVGGGASGTTMPRLASSAPAAWPAIATSGGSHGSALPAEADVEADVEAAGASDEDEGVLCAICHGSIKPQEAALVRGCDHPFCVGCILNWALQRPKCPLCNTTFTHLWTYRMLDGTYNDFLVENHVELLTQTTWFKKQVSTDFSQRAVGAGEDDDDYHEQLQYMYGGGLEDEDVRAYFDEMEDGLVGRRGGGGRRAFANRPWGSGGVVSAGRCQARARPQAPRVPLTPSAKSPKDCMDRGSCSRAGSSAAVAPELEGLSPDRGSTEGGGNSAGKRAMRKAEKALQRESQKERRREMAQGSKRGVSRSANGAA